MTGPWIALLLVLAALTVVNSVLLVALARYVGVIVNRLPQPVALGLSQGPAKGSSLEPAELPDSVWSLLPPKLQDRTAVADRSELIVFLSTRCSACTALLDDLNRFTKDHPDVRTVTVISGERGIAERMRDAVPRLDSVVDEADPVPLVAQSFGVQTVPFGLFYKGGVLTAKGVVNDWQMLDALVSEQVRQDGDELLSAGVPVPGQEQR